MYTCQAFEHVSAGLPGYAPLMAKACLHKIPKPEDKSGNNNVVGVSLLQHCGCAVTYWPELTLLDLANFESNA